MFTLLSFQQIVNRLPTIAAKVWVYEGDVYPICTVAGVLPDELVEIQMSLDEIKPLAAFLHVATDAEVCRLSSRVLRVRDTTNGTVELFTAEAARYGYRLVHRLSERFEHVGSEIHQ